MTNKFQLIHPTLRHHNNRKETSERSNCWKNMPLTKDMDDTKTKDRIIKSSVFELQKMGIIRLSDNILNYDECSQQTMRLPLEWYFNKLTEFLKGMLSHEELNSLKIQLLENSSIPLEINTSSHIENNEQSIKQYLIKNKVTTSRCTLC
ncbi:MAG: hypothetical protein ACR2HS_03495 [Gammaproteobacteria bacterium]